MDDLGKLCFSCMRPKGDHPVCPHCGSEGAPQQDFPLLPLGSLVGGRYYIGRVTRKNSEGVTYLAYDTKEDLTCSVREFFPESLAVRDDDTVSIFSAPGSEQAFSDCRESFNEMWKKLMRLKGLTALINVTDVFAAGNTSYAVYAETEEETLRDRLLSTPQGYMDWEQARILFMPVLSTLGTLHTSGVIHKGINPEAFIFTSDGKLKLTDFCIPQVRLAFRELEADIHDGYAPLEVYKDEGAIGSWTDIYSFSAVLYRALVGSTPISAPVRAQNDQMMIPAKFAENLPPYVINALINGMQINAEDRTRNVEQLRSNLSASPRAVSASASIYKAPAALNIPTGDLRKAPGTVAPEGVERRKPQPAPQQAMRQTSSGGTRPLNVPQTARPSEARARLDAEAAYAEQQKREKKGKQLKVLLALVILLLLVGVGLVVSALLGGGGSDTTPSATQLQMLTVPNFVGQQFDAVAADAYYSQHLRLIKVEENSTSVPSGQITYQSIVEGTMVTQGTEIVLTVSSGPRSFELPDVTGQTYEQALATLGTQGLVCSKASKYNDGTHLPDTVAETVPPAGTRVTQGDSVQVVLWGPIAAESTSAGLPETTGGQQNTTAVQPSVSVTDQQNTTVTQTQP